MISSMKDQFRIAAIAVIVILAVGLAVTGITKNYIDRNSSGEKAAGMQQIQDEDKNEDEKLPQNGAQNAAKEEAEKKAETEKLEVAASLSAQPSHEDEKDAYYENLEDMDSKLSVNVASSKENASNAYKAWDGELNAIYQKIRAEMTEEEFIELRDEERAWLKKRDQEADKAAEGLTGDEQEIAYLSSLTETTKARTYELAKRYFSK